MSRIHYVYIKHALKTHFIRNLTMYFRLDLERSELVLDKQLWSISYHTIWVWLARDEWFPLRRTMIFLIHYPHLRWVCHCQYSYKVQHIVIDITPYFTYDPVLMSKPLNIVRKYKVRFFSCFSSFALNSK